MFVSDSNIFPSSKIKLRVTCMDGSEFIGIFRPDSTVDNLKVTSLAHFFDPSESMKNSLYHKVVLVRNGRCLEDDKALQEQGVVDNDELLLLKRRLCPAQFENAEGTKSERGKKGPTAEEIAKATASTPVSDPGCDTMIGTGVMAAADFQTELRRILISLIEVSQKLLCLNPEASKIFKQAEEILNEQAAPASRVDDSDLKQLMDMGFKDSAARKSLQLNKHCVEAAMDWLLIHGDDDDESTPNKEDTKKEEQHGAEGGNQTDELEDGQTDKPTTNHRVSNILHSLRAYRKREFQPNQKALQHLLEMGFEEKDVVDSLRVTRNDGDAACDWLLGDKKVPPEDVDDGLEEDSPLFKAIMAHPTVQLGLSNPRCLLAFIQMLEHPHTASQWLSDPETAPLLVQVSRIYHAEKNSEIQQNHVTQKQTKSAVKLK